jgi:serine/threonine-protein kinase
MADLYLARHVLIDRLSAIKVLRPDVGRDRGLRALFLREAKAVNRINHPNILEITDYGETDDTAYLVMEYVPGEPLKRLLGTGPLGWERATRIGLQIAYALSRAHEMGVIIGSEPVNVIVVQQRAGDDLVKLTDFGVASSSRTGNTGAHRACSPKSAATWPRAVHARDHRRAAICSRSG